MANTVSPAKNLSVVLAAGVVSTNAAAPTFSTAVATGQANQTAAYVDFTLGSLTQCSLIFQASPDNVNWYTKPILDFASGAAASGYYQIPTTASSIKMTQTQSIVIDIPSCYQYVRFGAYCATTTTGSSLAISIGSGAV